MTFTKGHSFSVGRGRPKKGFELNLGGLRRDKLSEGVVGELSADTVGSRGHKNKLRIFKQYRLSPESMTEKANLYFDTQMENKMPLTMAGLCNTLQVTRETFNKYADREEFKDIVLMIKQRLEQFAEEQLFILKNVQGAMMVLTNHYKWSNGKEGNLQGGDKIQINIQPELYAKYAKKSPLITEAKEVDKQMLETPNESMYLEVDGSIIEEK